MFREDGCEEKSGKRNFFEKMVMEFFSHIMLALEQKIELSLRRQGEKIKKSIVFAVMLIVGVIYVLNALALFASEYMHAGNWAGYGVVGIVLIVLGFILGK